MNAYTYQAALYCEDCALAIRADLEVRYPNPNTYDLDDSEHYPQGPYPDGGGEADSPKHCDACHTFLENPLTDDGYDYVREALQLGQGNGEVLREWAEYYGFITA